MAPDYSLLGQTPEDQPTRLERFLRRVRPRPQEQRRLLRTSLEDWLVHLNSAGLEGSTWMGVTAFKNPLDAWIYQEIVHDTAPEVIVELGSAGGGSTLFLAHMLDLIGRSGQVVSVDASHEGFQPEHERIIKVTGTTGSSEVIERVRAITAGKRTMVIHDAGHRARIVLEDLRTYGPLVSPGCYLIVEDGISDWIAPQKIPGPHPGPGPYAALEAFLAENPPFDVDTTRERFRATNNPRGFLLRRDA